MTIQSLQGKWQARALERARHNTDYTNDYRIEEPLNSAIGGIRQGGKILIQGKANTFRIAFVNYLIFMMLENTRHRPGHGWRDVVISSNTESLRGMIRSITNAMLIHDGIIPTKEALVDLENNQMWFKRLQRRMKRGRIRLSLKEIQVSPEEEYSVTVTNGGQVTQFSIGLIGRSGHLRDLMQGQLADIVLETSTIQRQLYVTPRKRRGKAWVEEPFIMKKFNDFHNYHLNRYLQLPESNL